MPKLIGKWSLRHDKCAMCLTRRFRHHSNGLCVRCYDLRFYRDHRAGRLAASRAYGRKHGGDPAFRELHRQANQNWRKNSSTYLWSYTRSNFRSFLRRWAAGAKPKAIERIQQFRCQNCPKRCLMNVPWPRFGSRLTENVKMRIMIDLFTPSKCPILKAENARTAASGPTAPSPRPLTSPDTGNRSAPPSSAPTFASGAGDGIWASRNDRNDQKPICPNRAPRPA